MILKTGTLHWYKRNSNHELEANNINELGWKVVEVRGSRRRHHFFRYFNKLREPTTQSQDEKESPGSPPSGPLFKTTALDKIWVSNPS